MVWKGERQRHGLSARGINSTANVVKYHKDDVELNRIFGQHFNEQVISIKPLVSAIHFNDKGYLVETRYGTYYILLI